MNTPATLERDQRSAPRQPTAHEFIVVLSRIYSEAGLPAREAYLSAVADYECGFGECVSAL